VRHFDPQLSCIDLVEFALLPIVQLVEDRSGEPQHRGLGSVFMGEESSSSFILAPERASRSRASRRRHLNSSSRVCSIRAGSTEDGAERDRALQPSLRPGSCIKTVNEVRHRGAGKSQERRDRERAMVSIERRLVARCLAAATDYEVEGAQP